MRATREGSTARPPDALSHRRPSTLCDRPPTSCSSVPRACCDMRRSTSPDRPPLLLALPHPQPTYRLSAPCRGRRTLASDRARCPSGRARRAHPRLHANAEIRGPIHEASSLVMAWTTSTPGRPPSALRPTEQLFLRGIDGIRGAGQAPMHHLCHTRTGPGGPAANGCGPTPSPDLPALWVRLGGQLW